MEYHGSPSLLLLSANHSGASDLDDAFTLVEENVLQVDVVTFSSQHDDNLARLAQFGHVFSGQYSQ